MTAAVNVLSGMVNCCVLYEIAQGRFRFMWYAVPLNLMKSFGLYFLAQGDGFDAFAQSLGFDLRYCRLTAILTVFICAQVLLLIGFAIDLWRTMRRELDEERNPAGWRT